MMLKKWAVLILTTVGLLAACHSPLYNQTEANVADVKIKASEARHKSDNDAKAPPPLVVKQGLYVDTSPISLSRSPQWLKNRIVIRGDQLPFSYYSRTIAGGAGSHVLTKYQTGLDPAVNVTLNYTGTVKGALDLLASKSGYVYTIHGGSIYWQAFITRTFDIAFMPGGTDYLMGKSSSSSSASQSSGGGAAGTGGMVSNYVSSDASDSEYSNLKGTLSVWTDLENTIKQLLSADGKVVVSQSTTSVTVRDKPSNVELIAQFIANMNKAMSKQVLVKVQVLEVSLESDYIFGINWQLIERAFNKSPFVINGSYGTPISISQVFTPQSGLPTGAPAPTVPVFGTQVQPNTNNPIPSYTILFNALNQQGKTSVVTEPRVVCLNNQVSVVRIVKQQGYLASVQNTSIASGGTAPTSTVTSQLTPGTVITGLTLYILPKIMKDKVFLQVNADLSTAGAFGTISSGTQSSANNTQIQTPNITEKHFNQRSVIKSGDTLILAGFRQVSNQANANQFVTSQALGGKGAQQLNTETIVLITPIILNGSL
jgi:MSHA biogenesis protein MshL